MLDPFEGGKSFLTIARPKLISMSKSKLIRDAVHGDIEVSSLEVELMDTPGGTRWRL